MRPQNLKIGKMNDRILPSIFLRFGPQNKPFYGSSSSHPKSGRIDDRYYRRIFIFLKVVTLKKKCFVKNMRPQNLKIGRIDDMILLPTSLCKLRR